MGSIYNNGKDGVKYNVTTLEELTTVIIPHFNKYPLMTQKRADFELFKEIIVLIKGGEHLNSVGLQKILDLRASLNNGLSDVLKAAFPNTQPVARPQVEQSEIPDPHWFAGFTGAEGCYFVSVFKSKTKTGFNVTLNFRVSQHVRDAELMKSCVSFLGCGRIEPDSRGSAVNFVVTRFSEIAEKIVPFFEEYPIVGAKAKDLEDFCKVALIMKDKGHLTEEGLKVIQKIKSGMNSEREFINQD